MVITEGTVCVLGEAGEEGGCPVCLQNSRPTSRTPSHLHAWALLAAQAPDPKTQLGCSQPTQEFGLRAGSPPVSVKPEANPGLR